MPLGPVVSTRLASAAERRDENTGQRNRSVDNTSACDDMSNVIARERRPSQRPMTLTADQRSDDVWFEPRQRSRNTDYHQRGDERCFVPYVAPVYSRAVHTRSGRRPGQFTTHHNDHQSDSGQTVDL